MCEQLLQFRSINMIICAEKYPQKSRITLQSVQVDGV